MEKFKLKDVIDVLALLVAALAFFYSVNMHNQTVQRQTLLEVEKVRPHLQGVFLKADSEPDKGIRISNVGFGPAIIKSFKYYVDEENYKKGNALESWVDDKGEKSFTKEKIDFDEVNVLFDGYVIAPSSQGNVFLLRNTMKQFYERQVRHDMENLIIEIEYKSLSALDDAIYYLKFNEKFVANNVRERAVENRYE